MALRAERSILFTELRCIREASEEFRTPLSY